MKSKLAFTLDYSRHYVVGTVARENGNRKLLTDVIKLDKWKLFAYLLLDLDNSPSTTFAMAFYGKIKSFLRLDSSVLAFVLN